MCGEGVYTSLKQTSKPQEITMKKLVTVLLCSLFAIVSVQSAFAAKTSTTGAKNHKAAVEQTVAGPININDADIDMLMSLPGIGEKTARQIGTYRDANGPFKSVDELINVKGIGPKLLEKIRPMVSLS